MVKGEVIWAAYPGAQSAFLSCPYDEVLADGDRGGGKTDVLIMDFAQHVNQGFGSAWRGVLFRRTYPELGEVIERTRELFPKLFGNQVKYVGQGAEGFTWRWKSGEFLRFRHARTIKDAEKYLGHEYPWIGYEELVRWPDADCYDSLNACCRSKEPGIPLKIRSTTNSYGPGRDWVKKRFVDPAPERGEIRVAVDVNGVEQSITRCRIFIPRRENIELMENDPAYEARLASIADPNKRASWLGTVNEIDRWNITSNGIVSDIWDELKHVTKPFVIPRSWRVDRSFDWGSSKPFSVLWWAQSDGTEYVLDGIHRSAPRGSVFLIHQLYGADQSNDAINKGLRWTPEEIASAIREQEAVLGEGILQLFVQDGGEYPRVNRGPADNAIFSSDPGESTIADKMMKMGVGWKRSNKSPGSRVRGAEKIRSMLTESTLKHPENPVLVVFDTCRDWIRVVPNLPRSEKDLDDVDTNVEDHDWDCTRYRLSGRGGLVLISRVA